MKKEERRPGVRWWLVVVFILTGLLCILMAAAFSYGWTELDAEDTSFWSGLFVNVGTSLLLAALLVWFERVIVRDVQKQTQSTVEQAVSSAANTAAQRTADALIPRIEDIDARLKERAETQVNARTAATARLAAMPTFEAVRLALAKASEINAIQRWSDDDLEGGTVIVPAGGALDSPRIRVVYSAPDHVSLTHMAERGKPSTVEWNPGQSPDEVFGALHDQMVKDGTAPATHQMSVERLFGNLSALLTDATKARHADGDAWLSGQPVLEMVMPDCVISEAGVEVREHGVAATKKRLGRYTRSGHVAGDSVSPLPPGDLDQDTWNKSLERARHHFAWDFSQ